jgi:MATE family multidrug resistance protein
MTEVATTAGSRHRQVWRLAGPIIVSNVSVPLLGAVDTGIMGHLEAPAFLGAVALGAVILSYIYWGFGFLRMATTGFIAQASGRADHDEVRAVFARSFALAIALGVAVIALQGPVLALALALLEGSTAVETLAGEYFSIRAWGAPAALANFVVVGWLIGRQRAGTTLALQLLLNGTNAALDFLFVVGFGLGVAGVAAGTVIAEYLAAAVGLAVVWRRAALLDTARFAQLFAVNRDIFLRTLFLVTTFALFTSRGALQGDAILAANALLVQFLAFVSHGLYAFAHATEALVGHAIGTRDRRALRQSVATATMWSGLVAIGFSLAYLVGGWLVIDLLTTLPEVRAQARDYLPWMVGTPLIAMWAYQFDGVYLGAIRPKPMRNSMLLAMLAFVAVERTLDQALGNHALWLALAVFLSIRAGYLLAAYPRLLREALAS